MDLARGYHGLSASSFIDLVNSGRYIPVREPDDIIDGYITHEPESGRLFVSLRPFAPTPPPEHTRTPPALPTMLPASDITPYAPDHLGDLVSNPYRRFMVYSRPFWYTICEPIDTAPRCFRPSMRSRISPSCDWRKYAQAVAFQAERQAKRSRQGNHEVYGAVRSWRDPAEDNITKMLFTRPTEVVEFMISRDPLHIPHIFVSHSEGEEPSCLDQIGNPDALGSIPHNPGGIPNICGYTPRQSFFGPTRKVQLFLPPKACTSDERDASIIEHTLRTMRRRDIMRRKAGEFHAGLRRTRVRCTGDDLIQGPAKKPGYEDLSKQTERSLARLGIISHVDIATTVESVDFFPSSPKDEEADKGEHESGEELSGTTLAVLRRFGMVGSDSESDSEADESDSEHSTEASDNDSNIPGSSTISFASAVTTSTAQVQSLPVSPGCWDLARLASDIDDNSSVSSLFAGDESDSESPDTESDC